MKSATKKKATKGTVIPFVGCCSTAIDLVFTDGSISALTGTYTASGSIRIKRTGGKIGILGLNADAVNMGTDPWQVFVIKADKGAAALKPAKKKKK